MGRDRGQEEEGPGAEYEPAHPLRGSRGDERGGEVEEDERDRDQQQQPDEDLAEERDRRRPLAEQEPGDDAEPHPVEHEGPERGEPAAEGGQCGRDGISGAPHPSRTIAPLPERRWEPNERTPEFGRKSSARRRSPRASSIRTGAAGRTPRPRCGNSCRSGSGTNSGSPARFIARFPPRFGTVSFRALPRQHVAPAAARRPATRGRRGSRPARARLAGCGGRSASSGRPVAASAAPGSGRPL